MFTTDKLSASGCNEQARENFRHSDNLLREKALLWALANTCNYHCSYCEQNTLYGEHNKISNYQNIIDGFKRLPGVWNVFLSGGEPQIIEDLPKIIGKIADDTSHNITLVTNLSLEAETTIGILERGRDRIKLVVASWHPEHCEPENFLEKALVIRRHLERRGAHLVVHCVSVKESLPYLQQIGKKFRSCGLNFFLIPQRVHRKFVKYSDTETSIIKSFSRCFGLDDTNFKGRICHSGARYFVLNNLGEAYRCNSTPQTKGHPDYLGSFQDRTFRLLESSQECSYDNCHCSLPFLINMIEGLSAVV